MKSDQSSQPNLNSEELPPKLWGMILLTGAGAGLCRGLLMKLLRLTQHLSYGYEQGNFLEGTEHASGMRRFLMSVLAGALAGLVLYVAHRRWGKDTALNEAIWKSQAIYR